MSITSTKHSPAPWSDTIFDAGYAVVYAGDDHQVAVCVNDPDRDVVDISTATMCANARLIAAAPALLDALHALVEMADDRRYDAVPADWSADARLNRADRLAAARRALKEAL